MTAPTHFDAVIQGLLQDQSLTRIKKLLLYLCRNQWENNPTRLDELELSSLVQELLQIAPELDYLQAKLNKVVKALNKPAEYALVANAIVYHLKPLYSDNQDTTQIIGSEHSYAEIAASLAHDPQTIRIRKILFCACNGRWENDPLVLNRYPLEGLTQRLHTLTPSLDELKAVLYSIVKTLNRQAEYTLVANTVIEALTPLYNPVGGTTRILFAADPSAVVAPSLSVRVSPPTQQMDMHSAPEIPSAQEPAVELPKEPPDVFDLRLEVMKYTSPLRAKVLLFSTFYQSVETTDEGWGVVRSHDLDELLRAILDHYLLYESLENALKETAKTLSDSKQYLQAAGAILRAVRSWYDYTATASGVHSSPLTNEVSRPPQPLPSAPVQFVSPPTETEDTCSFLPPPVPPEPLGRSPEAGSTPRNPSSSSTSSVANQDNTLDLSSPSIHQEITLGLPEPPELSSPTTDDDTGLLNTPPHPDER